MRNGRKALVMLASSLLTAVLLIVWPVQPRTMVETAVIQRGELVQTVLMNGTVCWRDQQANISLRSGRLERVFVSQGQEIRKGDLLFKLDTAAEEEALALLHEQRFAGSNALSQLNEAAPALALQNELEWQNLETQLMAGIEASQIRAAADGVMEAVYVQEGDYVAETSLLGTAHGTGLQIIASAYAGGSALPSGTSAAASTGEVCFPVRLDQIGAADENGMQTFLFEPLDEQAMDGLRAGDAVRIEVTDEVYPVSALIPLSAIDAAGRIWTVENGKASAHQIDTGACSRTHASADLSWADETVILHPDSYALTDGMAVQVRK